MPVLRGSRSEAAVTTFYEPTDILAECEKADLGC